MDPWQHLGIAPTSDASAIKAAYAKLLRRTRPDDDAAAYQALREAYDRALRWAKAQPQRRAEEPPPGLESAPAAASPHRPASALAATFTASDEVEPPLEGAELLPSSSWEALPTVTQAEEEDQAEADEADTRSHWEPRSSPPPASGANTHAERLAVFEIPRALDPEALASRARDAFHAGGYAGLRAIWPEIELGLDGVPLTEEPRAARAFAAWTLEAPTLPPALVLELEQRFRWTEDFRVAASLGRAMARGLLTRVALARKLNDDRALRWSVAQLQLLRAAPTTGLWARFRHAARLGLRSALAPYAWRAFDAPGFADTLQVAGANSHEQRKLTDMARLGAHLRVAAGMTLGCSMSLLLLVSEPRLSARAILGLGLCVACRGGYTVSQLFAGLSLRLLDPLRRKIPALLRPRNAVTGSMVAHACVFLLALFAGTVEGAPSTAPIARLATGAWARLPQTMVVLAGMLWVMVNRAQATLCAPALALAAWVWSGPMQAEGRPHLALHMGLMWLGFAQFALDGLREIRARERERIEALRAGWARVSRWRWLLLAPLLPIALPLVALLLLVIAPALPFELARRHHVALGYVPFCVALFVGCFAPESETLVALCTGASAVALHLLENRLTRAAERSLAA